MDYKKNKIKLNICQIRRVFSLGAILILLFLGLSARAADNPNQRILDLREQIAELERQAEQYKKSITTNQKKAQSLAREISIITDQVRRLETQIVLTEKQIDKTGVEIENVNADIFDTRKRIVNEQEVLENIISIINRRDKENVLMVLLKNNDLSDFFNEIQNTRNIQERLSLTLGELRVNRESFESQREILEGKKAELQSLNQSQTYQRSGLSSTRVAKDDLLDKTKGEEARYQSLLSEIEKKSAQFFDELQALERQTITSGAYILHVTAPGIPAKGPIFSWPHDGVFTQGYGFTTFAKRGAYGGSPHNGVDVSGGFGTPIGSIGAGKLLVSGKSDGWGNWVAVQHDNGLVSIYGHMQSPTGLANGTRVERGSIIGFEGSTGFSTGAHVHLSLYHDFFTYINKNNGQIYFNYFEGTLNPLDYLP
ncbi:MAG: hypothetical protein COV31_01400 [Candidatus Yanofskybacteria bacterium CG10_big_fil_rev_8_21_14_0_10_46_23]|uniref:M23ase beta-sheet core domain-containing protein n=1 Tax=Candidatus Yanofskybacteria bacterium CG10_big_fil_rev_8_21_14_0_10_46_23 TaxID=1975098 RepID=A0A2H0R4R0_9BACT|nr:MAG: hypothetical protein COV31_01400 [Candidatus Yanofskybacteria bacterium CG10_big_fil_rev_8_21_14_0_10_46_23]